MNKVSMESPASNRAEGEAGVLARRAMSRASLCIRLRYASGRGSNARSSMNLANARARVRPNEIEVRAVHARD